MTGDIGNVEKLLGEGRYELVVSYLIEGKHPIISELKIIMESGENLSKSLVIGNTVLTENDTVMIINAIQLRSRQKAFLRFINIGLGIIALGIGLYGLILVIQGKEYGIQYICALPSGLFLIYVGLL